MVVNVAELLRNHASAHPDQPAVIVARTNRGLSYGELDARSDAIARGLVEMGLSGQRVTVMAPPSLDFFALVFGLFKAAAVPVMIDPGMGLKNLKRCLIEAEPEAFIGTAKALLARRLFGWPRGRIAIRMGGGWALGEPSLDAIARPGPFPPPRVEPDDMAAILFTSGSTGLAKGAVYTHGIFTAQVALLKSIYRIEPGEVDLCTFPLFALFGPALGMTCIVPTMNFSRPATIDPARTVQAIERYRVTNLFGSPAVIARLGEHGARLPTLKRVISAGAPASLPSIERLARLTDAPIFTPYGATEALPVANIASDELLATRHLTESGHGICIGRPVPGVQVHLLPIHDEAMPSFDPNQCLAPGEIGEFVVRGPIVTQRYWRRDESTRLAKMHDRATGETLHRMGDVGYRDAEGRLWYCGRKSQRIVTESGTLYPDQIEAIFNAVPGVARTALVGVKSHPVLCVQLSHSNRLWADVERDLRKVADRDRRTIVIRHLLWFRGSLPVDVRHNSKLNRERIAVWAARHLR